MSAVASGAVCVCDVWSAHTGWRWMGEAGRFDSYGLSKTVIDGDARGSRRMRARLSRRRGGAERPKARRAASGACRKKKLSGEVADGWSRCYTEQSNATTASRSSHGFSERSGLGGSGCVWSRQTRREAEEREREEMEMEMERERERRERREREPPNAGSSNGMEATGRGCAGRTCRSRYQGLATLKRTPPSPHLNPPMVP